MNRFALLFCLIGVSLVAAPRQTVTYDLTPNMKDGAAPLATGKALKWQNHIPEGARLHFEDLMPEANWAHPAIYRLVSPQGDTIEEQKANMPPEGLENFPVIAGQPLDGGAVEFKLNDYGGAWKVKDPGSFYAVLINGKANQRHWNDFAFLYRVLTQIYGYLPDHILVADGMYKDKSPDLEGKGEKTIQYGSKIADIKQLFTDLKSKLLATDHLTIAINDHGDSSGGQSTVVLMDGEMSATDFAALVTPLAAKSVLSIYEQCFSGGFVRPTVGRNRVAMSAATNREYSWGTADGNWDEFIYGVISAFAGQKHDGTPITAAVKSDKPMNARQAFAYAVSAERANESPLFEAAQNASAGTQIGLGF